MPRLRNARTGVVVNVTDETAARLMGAWEKADKPAPKHAQAEGEKKSSK